MLNQYKQFIREIISLFQQARKSIYPDSKIFRGRSSPISSKVEDLMAKFLVDSFNCDQIYIDQPLSVNRVKGITYPDLLIVKGNKVVGTCDIKLDMGWKRNSLGEICEDASNYIKAIRGKYCKIKRGVDKKEFQLAISENCFHNIIIISDLNNSRTRFNEQLNEVMRFKPSVNVFVLTTGTHLNTYNLEIDEVLASVEIRNEEFDRLIKTYDQVVN